MPYINNEQRGKLKKGKKPDNPGELNYLITKTIDKYIEEKGLRYCHLNEVIGVLECVKLELYRRIIAEYENEKIISNGDVYNIVNML